MTGLLPFLRGLGALLLLAPAAAAAADAGPRPPCAGGPVRPAPPPVGEPPVVRVDYGDDGAWTPPACLGWADRGFTVLVSTSGRFRHDDGVAALARRFARVSGSTRMRYWSHSRERWRPLIPEARALSRPDRDAGRSDFTAAELTPGAELYLFRDENSPAGAAVHRMTVPARGPGRLRVAMENVDTIHLLVLPLFGPGEYQTHYALIRERPGVWLYHALMRVGDSPNALATGHRPSYVNRAVAIYRYVAGIPTDREPPAAP